MFHFQPIYRSKKSQARIGLLETDHGTIETPAFVPVATRASIRTLTSEEITSTKTQIIIANTFHLHLQPGEAVIRSSSGIHTFMNWKSPIMTDSGGYQVFSLGFGADLGVGKLIKFFPEKTDMITTSASPKFLKITDDGVFFRSPINGTRLFLGPKESIRIQEKLGADIMFAFDECTPPLSSSNYAKKALDRTHRWAKISLDARKGKQALFGIVQGSHFKQLRHQSARYVNSLGFDGFGIGGDLGSSKSTIVDILHWTLPYLDTSKPRHLLGIGHLEDIKTIIQSGVDLFDCAAPTLYARHGIAFTRKGKLDLSQSIFLTDKKRIDQTCTCSTCSNYHRSYIAHLIRAKELTGLQLLTFHNLFLYNTYVESLRSKIKQGKL